MNKSSLETAATKFLLLLPPMNGFRRTTCRVNCVPWTLRVGLNGENGKEGDDRRGIGRGSREAGQR
jgi:hypothetical protein